MPRVLEGWAFSYERGTPVCVLVLRKTLGLTQSTQSDRLTGAIAHVGDRKSSHVAKIPTTLEGFLAHKRPPPPRTLQ